MSSTTAQPMQAIVKSVLSADTLVLRGKIVQPNVLPKEKVLHLADLTSPRLGTRDRPDEPLAFEARDYLRSLVVGKQVSFSISYVVSTVQPPLEFGIVYLSTPNEDGSEGSEIDVAAELVKSGWAKVRESNYKSRGGGGEEMSEEENRKAFLKDLEEEAKVMGRGLWRGQEEEREIEYQMPSDPAQFLAQYKGKPIDAIVESVTNGSQVRARLLFSPTYHQFINLGIAGLRAPRSGNLATAGREDSEEFGDESKFFLESRLLQRLVKITLLSLPTPSLSSAAANGGAVQSASLFLGTIQHPAGNIAALLVSSGLAKIIDWHAGFLSTSPTTPTMMQELRKAEQDAKLLRKGLWKDLPDPELQLASNGSNGTTARGGKGSFNAYVVKIWGTDMVSLAKTEMGKEEKKVQLASVRQPKPTDPRQAGLQLEGKEFLRKKLIGKQVLVTIDYIKPAEGDFEARECATIRLLPSGQSISPLLVERGFVSVLRHRQSEGDNKSGEYDDLMAAEMKAIQEKRGVHAGKDWPANRIIDASESAQKAAPFLSQFKRSGKLTGIVDFVASGSRFKIWIPKQDIKLTLVLSSIRTPRTARNASEKSEPYGVEAALWSNRKLLQREVEFSVETNDKSGGFIGKMSINGQDVAYSLVSEGLAKVDEYSVSKELHSAQSVAQSARKNLWSTFDPSAQQEDLSNGVNGGEKKLEARKEYVDVIVSEIRGGTETVPFSFSVQILKNGGIPELESLMSELTLFHQSSDVTPTGFTPKSGELVSAKFSADGQWYRAKVRKSNPGKKEAEVIYIDYGNSETVPYSKLRPLAAQFKSLPGQARDASLSFINLLDWRTEYGQDAMDRFRELCEGQSLVANIDHSTPSQLYLSLFDPLDPASLASHESSINVQLVREGLARIDRRATKLREAYPGVVRALDRAQEEAKRGRYGAYELGDILEDD
ncbi:uncharacterized protein JCM6883_006810 [Sporobolomyces salmoneus]|uniref:uncharacterized protein n=1 Tax=Sporobolomyces salmoneus TaxID=183962 RepID=UPI00316FFA97